MRSLDDSHREKRAVVIPYSVDRVQSAAVERRTIVVLEGDETGQELLEEALRVLVPDVIGVEFELPSFDLSLERPSGVEERGRLRGRRSP